MIRGNTFVNCTIGGEPLGSWRRIMRQDEMYELATRELRRELGRFPSRDEVIAEVAIRNERLRAQAELDAQQFVGVQFHGNSHVYTYRLKSHVVGTVGVGDYVAVHSPLTDQTELVRVVRVGRGDWNGHTKYCDTFTWSITRD